MNQFRVIMAHEKRTGDDVKRIKRRRNDDSILDGYFWSIETGDTSNVELQKKCSICGDIVLSQQRRRQPDETKNYLLNHIRQKHPEVFDDLDDQLCGPPPLRQRMTPSASPVDETVADVIDDNNPDVSSSDDETDGIVDGTMIDNFSEVDVEQETIKFARLLSLYLDGQQLNGDYSEPSQTIDDVSKNSSEGFDEPDAVSFSVAAVRRSSRVCADYCRHGSRRQLDGTFGSLPSAISSMTSQMSCEYDTVDGWKPTENAASQGDDEVDSGLNAQSDQWVDCQMAAGTSSRTGLSEEELREMGAILRTVADKFHHEHLPNGPSPSVSELLKDVTSYEVFDSVVSHVIRDDTILRQIALLYRFAGDAIKSKAVDVGKVYSWTQRYFQTRFAKKVAQSSGLENVVRNSPVKSNGSSV